MTSDLYDDAKPVRDATMVALMRAFDDDVPQHIREGNELAAHLTAILIAFSVKRHKFTVGQVVDRNIGDLIAIAIGSLLGHVATAYRPMRNGVPLTPVQNLPLIVAKVSGVALMHASHCEAGDLDFVVPFRLNDQEALEPEPFDIRDFLKGPAK